MFRGSDESKRPRRIRLIGPIAVRATGPKTFTLVGEQPVQLERLLVDKEEIERSNDNRLGSTVFSKRPSIQFDEDTDVSASFPQVISLIAISTIIVHKLFQIRSVSPATGFGSSSPGSQGLTLENVPVVSGPATNYLRGDSSPQPTLATSSLLPQKIAGGGDRSQWAAQIVTPPASANMRPFKTAVAAVDMNLGSGWNKQTAKKAPALHFDDQGRQRTYVRFEEVCRPFHDDVDEEGLELD